MLNILAEEPLKHTSSLLWAILLIHSEHLSGEMCSWWRCSLSVSSVAFGSICDWHMAMNLSKFGWVCDSGTDLVSIPRSGHLPAPCAEAQLTVHQFSALLCLTRTPPGTCQA